MGAPFSLLAIPRASSTLHRPDSLEENQGEAAPREEADGAPTGSAVKEVVKAAAPWGYRSLASALATAAEEAAPEGAKSASEESEQCWLLTQLRWLHLRWQKWLRRQCHLHTQLQC